MIEAQTIYLVKNEKGLQNYSSTVTGETYTELYQKDKEVHKKLLQENEYVLKLKTYYKYNYADNSR